MERFEYKTLNTSGRTYFFGANSADGFLKTRDRAISEKDFTRSVIIKGGPGTGKSSLMRRFSEEAAAAGYDVTEYLCSSDPSSLDAVMAKRDGKTLFVTDGTSPHASDPQFPGAVSIIFDLTAMWKDSKLQSSRDEIIELTEKKRECFDRAYALLRAAREVRSVPSSLLDGVINKEKLLSFADRFSKKALKKRTEAEVNFVYTEALSMRGAVRVEPHKEEAREVYYITERYGAEYSVMRALFDALTVRGVRCEASLAPADLSLIDSLFLPDTGTLISLLPADCEHKSINTSRFITDGIKEVRHKLRFFEKCRHALICGALSSLAAASEYHFELEKIYSSSMNFKAVDRAVKAKVLSMI